MNQQSQEWESWMQSKMIPKSFNLDTTSLYEMKNYRSPHPLVQMCLNSVGLLFLVQNKDWNKFKNELIGEPEIFVSKINGYDINRINRELYDELESQYTSLPEFNVSEMKKVSPVIAELGQWVLYMRDRASYKFKDLKPFQREFQEKNSLTPKQQKEKSPLQQKEQDPMMALLSQQKNQRVLQSVQSLNEQQYNDCQPWFQIVLEQDSKLKLQLADFKELKALTHPSALVQLVSQAVGVLLQLHPNDWSSFLKELQVPQNFLNKLLKYESNDITYEQYIQLKKLINANDNFDLEVVNRVSKAAVQLTRFVLLQKNYAAMIFQDFKTIQSLNEPNHRNGPQPEIQQPLQEEEEAFDPALYYPSQFGRQFSSEELDYLQQLRSQINPLTHSLITELKAFKNPNEKIVFVMKGASILVGDEFIDWKAYIGQIKSFVEKANQLDIDRIPQDRVKLLYRDYVSKPNFDFENVQHVSTAAAFIAQFVSSAVAYLRFAYNIQDESQNQEQQKNPKPFGTPIPKKKADINRLKSAKAAKSLDPFAKSNDKYYQKQPVEKTIGFYEVEKGYQVTRARSPTTKLAAARNSTIQKSVVKLRDKSPLYTPIKLQKSILNVQQISEGDLKQMSRDDKINLLNTLNQKEQQLQEKEYQMVGLDQKRPKYPLAINKNKSQDIVPKTGQRESQSLQGEKNEGKAALVAQEDQLNHQEVISYLKQFLETHSRVQDPVDDIKAIFDKIVEWKSQWPTDAQQQSMVRQRLSEQGKRVEIHNVRSLHRKFSEFKDEIGLTNDEVNLIMFSAADEDWFNNLLIQSAEFTAWFRMNFKGESQWETDFLNERAHDLEQCVDFSELVISEYNKLQDKNQIIQHSWWQNIRFKQLGEQLKQKFAQNSGLQSKILQWFQQHDEKISYYHLFQFIEKDCGIKSKNYVERMLEKRLDPHSFAFITFVDFFKFTTEYGIKWPQSINPQEDLKFEKKMFKLENQSYSDYKVTKKDYFMGCPTMLTSEKAALAKCYQIYEETTFKLAQGQRAMLFFDQDFGPKRKTDLEGCKKAMYKTGEPPSRVHPDPNQTEWVFVDTLCKPGEVLKFADEGFSSQDALQGLLGDCYFVTALSQLALREDLLRGQIDVADLTPGMIIDAEIANKLCQGVYPFIFQKFSQIGLYILRFYKNYQWIYVLVDQRIPVDKTTKKPIYGHCRNINELWIPLIEKAYAKLNGCYENLVAGFVDQAIHDLTGYQPERLIIQENQLFPSKIVANMGGADGLWNYLKLRKYDKSIMSCSIKIQGKHEKSGEAIHDGVPSGLLMNHSYGLLDLFELKGTNLNGQQELFRLVVLRNPHGRAEWKGEWSAGTEILQRNQRSLEDHIKEMDDEEEFSLNADDGIFLIPYQNFIEFFTNLFINIDFPEQWSGVRFSSAWTQDNAVGLPTAYVTQQLQNYARNPQFYLQPAIDTEVVLSLGQTGGRLPIDGKYFNYPFMETLNYTCAAVFELRDDEDYLTAFDKDRLLCITPICCELENTIRFQLQAGHSYVIVCSTEIANRTGDFFLNVFFNCELRDMEIVRIFHPNDRNLAREQVLPELIPELAEHKLTQVPNWKLKMINDQLIDLNQSDQKTQLIIDGQVSMF